MPKLKSNEDLPAILVNERNLGHLSKELSQRIYDAALKGMKYEVLAREMLHDIAYRIGYINSKLVWRMSETTYKKKKEAIRRELWKICKEVFK